MGTTTEISDFSGSVTGSSADDELRAGESRSDHRFHYLTVLGLLFALLPVAGTQAVWSADEGALLYQVDSLAAGQGWTFDHPFPQADPGGTYFPIHLSSWAAGQEPRDGAGLETCQTVVDGCRYVVLAKHVGYLWVAAGLYQLGGYPLIIALSVLASGAAAIAASRLAGLIEPAAARPALWITGLASPMFIDSYMAWAHTVGAALIGWSCYGLVVRGGRSHRWRVAGLLFLFLACQVRTEAPLAGLAIGLGLGLVAAVGRSRARAVRIDRLLSGGAAMVVSIVGVLVDRLTAVKTGGPVEPVGFDEAFGFVAGRIEAFTITWLQPAYGADPRDLLLLASATITLIVAVMARRPPVDARRTTVLLMGALLLVVARVAISPAALIPGLVVAFPVLFVGLLLLNRQAVEAENMAEILLPFMLFCGAVLATQYRHGGGGEWGGRYFAVGLPLGIAASCVGLVRAGAGLEPADRRRVSGLLLATMALLSGMGLFGLRAVRDQTADLATDIRLTLDELEASSADPVIVSSIDGFGRWMWQDIDRGRWLRVPQEDLPTVGARLRSLGVQQIALVSLSYEQELKLMEPWYRRPPTTGAAGAAGAATDGKSTGALPIFVLQATP